MRKIGIIFATIALLILPACSQPPAATQNTEPNINLPNMAADIAALKSNFTILNASFTALQNQVSSTQSSVTKADLDSLSASLNNLKTKVDAIVIPTIPPLTDYAKKADLDTLNAKLAADEATITALNATIKTLSDALTALTARVAKLEAPPTTTTTPPPTTTQPNVSVVQSMLGTAQLDIDGITETATFYLMLTNNTAQVVNAHIQLNFVCGATLKASPVPTLIFQFPNPATSAWYPYLTPLSFQCVPTLAIASHQSIELVVKLTFTLNASATTPASIVMLTPVIS